MKFTNCITLLNEIHKLYYVVKSNNFSFRNLEKEPERRTSAFYYKKALVFHVMWTSTRGGSRSHVDACGQGVEGQKLDFLVDVVNG